MTALADLLSATDRDKLAARLAELQAVDRLMREPGLFPAAAEPVPLHRACGTATTTTEGEDR